MLSFVEGYHTSVVRLFQVLSRKNVISAEFDEDADTLPVPSDALILTPDLVDEEAFVLPTLDDAPLDDAALPVVDAVQSNGHSFVYTGSLDALYDDNNVAILTLSAVLVLSHPLSLFMKNNVLDTGWNVALGLVDIDEVSVAWNFLLFDADTLSSTLLNPDEDFAHDL